MNRTKVAIIGAGFISDIHLESYHRFVPEAEVVAVYARNADKAKAFADKYHVPTWFNDVDQLLAETDAEVIDICVPNYLHAEVCIKAAVLGPTAFGNAGNTILKFHHNHGIIFAFGAAFMQYGTHGSVYIFHFCVFEHPAKPT